MADPASIIAAISNSLDLLTSVVDFGMRYRDVSSEVGALMCNIEMLDQQINTSKRLHRLKSDGLDSASRQNVKSNIDRAEKILESISEPIERCRKDLELKNTVRARGRIGWLLRDSAAVSSQLTTLTICMTSLQTDIVRMEIVTLPAPPSYHQAVTSRPHQGSPSVRRKLANEGHQASKTAIHDPEVAWDDFDDAARKHDTPQDLLRPGSWSGQADEGSDTCVGQDTAAASLSLAAPREPITRSRSRSSMMS